MSEEQVSLRVSEKTCFILITPRCRGCFQRIRECSRYFLIGKLESETLRMLKRRFSGEKNIILVPTTELRDSNDSEYTRMLPAVRQ